VQARTSKSGAGAEWALLISLEGEADVAFKHDYYLSNNVGGLPLKESSRVTKMAYRIQECFKRAKEIHASGVKGEKLDRLVSFPNSGAPRRAVPESSDPAQDKSESSC